MTVGLRAHQFVWGPARCRETWGDIDPEWVNGEQRLRAVPTRRETREQRRRRNERQSQKLQVPLDNPSSWVS